MLEIFLCVVNWWVISVFNNNFVSFTSSKVFFEELYYKDHSFYTHNYHHKQCNKAGNWDGDHFKFVVWLKLFLLWFIGCELTCNDE